MIKLMNLIQDEKEAILTQIDEQDTSLNVIIEEIQSLIEVRGAKLKEGSIITLRVKETEFKVKVLDSHKLISIAVLFSGLS